MSASILILIVFTINILSAKKVDIIIIYGV